MGDPTQTPRKSEIIRKSQDVATLASSHPLSLEYLRTDPRHHVMTLNIYGSASGKEWKGLLDVTSTHMSTTVPLPSHPFPPQAGIRTPAIWTQSGNVLTSLSLFIF